MNSCFFVEVTLKSFLRYRDRAFPRTHDLELLWRAAVRASTFDLGRSVRARVRFCPDELAHLAKDDFMRARYALAEVGDERGISFVHPRCVFRWGEAVLESMADHGMGIRRRRSGGFIALPRAAVLRPSPRNRLLSGQRRRSEREAGAARLCRKFILPRSQWFR